MEYTKVEHKIGKKAIVTIDTNVSDMSYLGKGGKTVKISGFVQTIRDLGGLVFLDIRDMYGITQVVTSGTSEDVDFASRIPVESTVCVTGEVRKRDEDTINKNIKTGEVEIVISNIEILGKRTKNLPFEVSPSGKRRNTR